MNRFIIKGCLLVFVLLTAWKGFAQKLEIIPQKAPDWYIYDLLLAKNENYLLYTETDHSERPWTVVDYKRKWTLYEIPRITSIIKYKDQVIIAQNKQKKDRYEKAKFSINLVHLDKQGKTTTLFNAREFSEEAQEMCLSSDERYMLFATWDSLFYADVKENRILKAVELPEKGTRLLSFSGNSTRALLHKGGTSVESGEAIYILDFADFNSISQPVYHLKYDQLRKLFAKDVTILQNESGLLVLKSEDFSLVKQVEAKFKHPTPIAYDIASDMLLISDSQVENDTTDRIVVYKLKEWRLVNQHMVPYESFGMWESPIQLNDSVILGYSRGNSKLTEYNIKRYKVENIYKNIPCSIGNLVVQKGEKKSDVFIASQCREIYTYDLDLKSVRETFPSDLSQKAKSNSENSSTTPTGQLKFDWGIYNFCSNKLTKLPNQLGMQYNDKDHSTKSFYKEGDTVYVKEIENDLVVAKFYVSVLPIEDVQLHNLPNDYCLVWQFKNSEKAFGKTNDPDYKRNRVLIHLNEINGKKENKFIKIEIPVNWEILKEEGEFIFVSSPTKDSCYWYQLKNGNVKKIKEIYLDYKKLGYTPFIDSAYRKLCADKFIFLEDEVDDFTGETIKRNYKLEISSNEIIVSPNGKWLIQYSSLDSVRYSFYNLVDSTVLIQKIEPKDYTETIMFDADGNEIIVPKPGLHAVPGKPGGWEFVPWNEDLLLFSEVMTFSVLDLKTNKMIYTTGIGASEKYFDLDNRTILFLSKDTIYSLATETMFSFKQPLKNKDQEEFRFLSPKLLSKGHPVIYNYQNHSLFRYYIFPDISILIDSNNYYMSNGPIKDELIFRVDSAYYEFEQFDLKYNRPDILINELSCSDTVLASAYFKAHQKRLKKLGFTEEMLKNDYDIPALKIKNFRQITDFTDSLDLNLEIEIEDKKHKLDRINIYLNDVPLFGSLGYSLKDLDTKQTTQKLKIALCQGLNKIQVSVLNQAGAESYKETMYVTYKPKQLLKPNLYLVTIGDSKYKDSRYNLSYAAKDAKDIGSVFKKSALYQNVFEFIYTDQKVTKENILSLKKELLKSKRDDVVIITVAGHGVLDKDLNYYLATYDMDFNNPSEKGLPYEDLESLVDGIAPLRKIIFLDACHSGEVDKDEVEQLAMANTNSGDVQFRAVGSGIQKKNLGLKTTSELMCELFTDLRRGTGATVISSAGGAEYAMESAQWKNGLFTYCLLHGLKDKAADANKDGQIMLSELQQYLRTEVTKLSNGAQQPTSRIENLSMDFRIW
jgi:uncharacterized caspase-like protein